MVKQLDSSFNTEIIPDSLFPSKQESGPMLKLLKALNVKNIQIL